MICRGKLHHYAMGAGTDPTGLGRWTWSRHRGKAGMKLRIVSIYQPCKNTAGALSVWSQHKQYLQNHNDDRNPRTAFLQDLKLALTSWIAEGDHILVGGDVNENVMHHSITSLFEDFHMTNLIFDHHDPSTAPSTYFRSSEGKVMDGIWGTPGLHVAQCGYLEPGDVPGDHSLLWADISYSSALGHDPPWPSKATARRLKLGCSKTTNKYLDRYASLVDQHHLLPRQFKLESTTSYGIPLTPTQAEEAEKIDILRTRCILTAEKKCRKLKMGEVDFSEAISIPTKHIAWWEVAIRRRRNLPVRLKLWERRKNEAGFKGKPTAQYSIQEMIMLLRQARALYRQEKKKHEASRKSFLLTLDKKDRDRLLRVEDQRKLARAAAQVTGKANSKSVYKVESEGQEFTTQTDIERILFPVNEEKIRSSEATPFMQPPLLNDFGYRTPTPAHDQVLEHTYIAPPGCDPHAAHLLHGLGRPPEPPAEQTPFQPRTHITTDDHIKGWKRQKERTAGGMSGLHFGHFKANIKRRQLAELDASMRSVAYTTGYAYKRWKKGIDAQLLKRIQEYLATKLRTILCLEPDFNMNNKVLGSDAMRSGERLHALARDNYGGRHGHRAAETSMNQLLTYNSIWGRRGRAVVMSNDAKGCYDRIAHVVVDLALQRLGAPRPALQSMLETIQEMEHHIRTAFGDSTDFYGNDSDRPPPQGILQGNGAGPAGWSAIAAVLIKLMREHGYGYETWTLIRDRAVTLVCFAFVDDTDLIHAITDRSIPTTQLLAEAQEALYLWEGLLKATGGALAPEKSYWYLIEVIRTNGKWGYAPASQNPYEMYLQGGTFTNTRLQPYQAREAIGIMIRPDGKMHDELKLLKKKANEWSDNVRTKRFHPSEAWYCLTATIMKTLEFPLMATTFTHDQCKTILRPILKSALNLCGVQKKIPRKLLHGSLRTRGLNLPDLYWTQLVEHIQAILRHMHRDTPSRDLHEENMDLVQFHIGSAVTFWDLPFEEYGSLAPEGWMKHTWKAIDSTQLSIKGPDLGIQGQRDKDISLMDAFVAQNLDAPTLNILKECRFYLGATHLSHISSACGSRLDPRCWKGKPTRSTTLDRRIHTYRPTTDDWKKWRTAIRQAFLFPNVTHHRLRQTLGAWTKHRDPQWIWWKHQASRTLYEQRSPNQWYRWTRVPRQFHQDKFKAPQPVEQQLIPQLLHRASIHKPKRSPYITVTSTGTSTPIPLATPELTTLSDHLEALPPSAKWALQAITILDNGATIAAAINTNTAIAVSDGSLKLGLGTAAYVLEGQNSTNRIKGVNKVPGPIKDGDSHRCEVSGIYSVILIITSICKLHNITNGSITISCDNLQSLRIFDPDYLPSPKDLNFDLVVACWTLKNAVPIRWNTEHIKGHQDKHRDINSLSRIARLNVEMDRTAKAYWHHLVVHSRAMPSPDVHPIYGEEWQIWRGTQKIAHPAHKILYALIHDPITEMWWTRNGHATHPAQAVTDWNATESAMHHLPLARRRWVTKQASENCGVGTTLLEWKHQPSAECPRCACQHETTAHVQRCIGHAATAHYNKSLTSVTAYLTKEKTRPDVQDAILTSLLRWRQQLPIQLHRYLPDVQEAIRQQHTIGWLDFMECLPAKAWQVLQFNYYRDEAIRKSSKRWIKGLLVRLHHLAWNQWDHRNKVKQHVTKPTEKHYIELLDREITIQLQLGNNTLQPGDHHHANHNLITLLNRSLAYRKAWLTNITAARLRFHRIQQNNNELELASQEASGIYQWMRDHRETPTYTTPYPEQQRDTTEAVPTSPS